MSEVKDPGMRTHLLVAVTQWRNDRNLQPAVLDFTSSGVRPFDRKCDSVALFGFCNECCLGRLDILEQGPQPQERMGRNDTFSPSSDAVLPHFLELPVNYWLQPFRDAEVHLSCPDGHFRATSYNPTVPLHRWALLRLFSTASAAR